MKGRWEGWAVEGEGRPLQCGICLMGEGRGRYWSLLQLHWFPSPTLPKEPEQCWQICLHVFIIIKNVTAPSSLEVQQILLIPFPPPPPRTAFAPSLSHLSLSSTLVFPTGGWGNPSFPLLSLVAPWGFLMVVESFKAMLGWGERRGAAE